MNFILMRYIIRTPINYDTIIEINPIKYAQTLNGNVRREKVRLTHENPYHLIINAFRHDAMMWFNRLLPSMTVTPIESHPHETAVKELLSYLLFIRVFQKIIVKTIRYTLLQLTTKKSYHCSMEREMSSCSDCDNDI